MKKFFLGAMWLNFAVVVALDVIGIVHSVYPLGIDQSWLLEVRRRFITAGAYWLISERLLVPLIEE